MPHGVARHVARRLTNSSPGGIQGPEIQHGAETAMDCFSEGETAKVDFSSYLAVTMAHLGREGVRVKGAPNPGPYAKQLRTCLSADCPQTIWRWTTQQEKAAREKQMASSGQELITGEEKMTPAEPQAADPQAGAGESADQRGHRLGETKTVHDGTLHTDPDPKEETETPPGPRMGAG
jgi:hypothetical protein